MKLWAQASALWLIVCCATPAGAADTDCAPASGVSTCVDASALWVPAGRPRFFGIAPGRASELELFAFGAAFTYSNRPIVLVAPSPDPEGREIRVVDHRLDAALLWAYSPAPRFELTLATPMVLYQSGAGAEGVTSQNGPPLTRSAPGDPRLGAGYELSIPEALARSSGLAVKGRTELVLPLGDENLYAGEDWFVLAPSIAASVERGIFFAGAEVGLRLRRSVHVASATLGSQLVSALGVGLDLLPDEQLAVTAEANLMPTLVAQSRARGDAVLVPAEWLASVRSAPFDDRGFVFQLGGGTGLPLSSSTDESGTDHQLGLTTPRFRLIFAVRYAPAPADKR